MELTFSGTYHGREAVVVWRKGTVDGDPEVAFELRLLAAMREGRCVGIPTAGTDHDHLQDPRSTWILFLELCHNRAEIVAGELPPIPDIPEGAVS